MDGAREAVEVGPGRGRVLDDVRAERGPHVRVRARRADVLLEARQDLAEARGEAAHEADESEAEFCDCLVI